MKPCSGSKNPLCNPNFLKLRNLVPDSPAVHSPNTACENPSCNPNNARFFHGIQVADVCYLLKNLLPKSNPKFLQLHPCEEIREQGERKKIPSRGTNISHLRKWKIIDSKQSWEKDMLVPWRVYKLTSCEKLSEIRNTWELTYRIPINSGKIKHLH